MNLFRDSPEYQQRQKAPFKVPEQMSVSDIHAAVPRHLLERSTTWALGYVIRDIVFAIFLYKLALKIDPFCQALVRSNGQVLVANGVRWVLWSVYWGLQGLVLAGWWVLGHEAGHNAISPNRWINHFVGYGLHTFLMIPYFSWRLSHQAHHKGSNSMEMDGTFVPRTRSQHGLPPATTAHITDYHDILEETPLYSLCRILIMQVIGWQAYLLTNAMGNPQLPAWTNHFSPSSALFKPQDRHSVIGSNVGLSVMACLISYYIRQFGGVAFLELYFVPYMLANHWVIMMTFIHHTDPTIPHYRGQEWSFLRGALATVDRPVLGWVGRFFFHNVSHDHIAHHFFTMAPFYNLPAITAHIKPVLKEHYNFDSTNCFRALYRSFTECCFIEDTGSIIFYKNSNGEPTRKFTEPRSSD